MTTPTPAQIAEWRNDAHLEYFNDGKVNISSEPIDAYTAGYLRARTEQATEIAELKAKLSEVMPLAKFGAIVFNDWDLDINLTSIELLQAAELASCFSKKTPEFKLTIERLLKE